VRASLLELDPATYRSHELHSTGRAFPETNCYTDVWIELLHAFGRDPLAGLAFCIGVDFEGDQWTFFKPPPADLELLYGAEVLELQIYRSLPEHIAEQLALGRPVIIEVDAFYLPDTAGRSYREQHEKTGIAVETIDEEAELLRYFHGTGYYEITGDDYRNALRIGRAFSADVLPPYVEFVRLDRLPAFAEDELRGGAHALLRNHLDRLPPTNPVRRFGARLAADLPALKGDPEAYHRYAFATVRQCGAAWEVASSFLSWLDAGDESQLAAAASGFAGLADESKTLLFKLARAAATSRPYDPAPAVESIAAGWDETIGLLTTARV
jgi:hypothetical protein